MRYQLVVTTVNEIEDEAGLERAFGVFRNGGWDSNDLETLYRDGELEIQDHVSDWGVVMKTKIKLIKCP